MLPGVGLLRLVMVTLVAGLALLSLVGAIITGQLWMDSRDAGVLPTERQQTWDSLDALRVASVGVIVALLIAVVAWTSLTVINVRRTSGRRFNPLFAAACWPAAAAAVWWIADRVIVGGSVGSVVLGLAAQAAVLACRSSSSNALRTPSAPADLPFASSTSWVWCCWFTCRAWVG